MAWQKLEGAPASVTVFGTTQDEQPDKRGRIEWNGATHMMMRQPDMVDVFHDPDTNRLGFRRIRANTYCANVVRENGDYHISAQDFLTIAEIAIVSKLVTVPHMPTPPTPPGDLGDEGIVWINLP